MIVIQAYNIKKQYNDRTILEFDTLRIEEGDRIGIVGDNGAGKTTLLDILSGSLTPDEGKVKIYAGLSYIRQFGDCANAILSGGEKTKFKIDQQLKAKSEILFSDEPTTNLDSTSIRALEAKLLNFRGTLLLISHDRELLDKICTSIIEVEDGKVKEYPGNYTKYKQLKSMEVQRQQFEYDQYVTEKKRLKEAIIEKQNHAKTIKKAPKRMGNSEARLHRREANEKQEKIHSAASAIATRLEKLDKKERPYEVDKIKIEFKPVESPISKVIVRGNGVSKNFGDKVLFNELDFEILNNTRTALIGNNGVGKTTLIKMILSHKSGISLAPGTKIGYFSQELDILAPDKTILENVLSTSVQGQSVTRTVLARLLFKRDDVFKKCSILSGGERVKASFAKLIVSDANFLIFDEPTNYLDLNSIEALQSVLREYHGALLFVSHDRRFVEEVAQKTIEI